MINKIKKLLKEFGVFTYNITGNFVWEDDEIKATEWVFHCNKTFGNPTLNMINKNIEDINHLFYKNGETAIHFVKTSEDLYISFKVTDLDLEQWYDELFDYSILYFRDYPVKVDKDKVKEILCNIKENI